MAIVKDILDGCSHRSTFILTKQKREKIMNNTVELKQLSLKEILVKKKLKIPSYQRIYCWKEKTVIKLLEDVHNIKSDYCIGSIILQKKNNETYDIIDGQQRLVTLSLLFLQLHQDNGIYLLDEKFEDTEAQKFIQYNKYLIENFCNRNRFESPDKLLDFIKLNVLILNDSSLDLAYTFFSNENSHGLPLSDYDLLKAHHLRYVLIEEQQKHLANRWDKMILSITPKDSDYKIYEQVLAIYIFRLRKWLNLDWWNKGEKYNVKNEFEASPIIDSIPPFCEHFNYYEPIQGGTHFFEFTDKAIEKLRNFKHTNAYKMIHLLNTESFILLRDVIEALLFAYYYKFGESYLLESLLLITRYISQVRYESRRIHLSSIFEHVRLSKIPLRIERSTSPTFFLATMKNLNANLMSLNQLKQQEKVFHKSDIRERYNARLKEVCFKNVKKSELNLNNINEWN